MLCQIENKQTNKQTIIGFRRNVKYSDLYAQCIKLDDEFEDITSPLPFPCLLIWVSKPTMYFF